MLLRCFALLTALCTSLSAWGQQWPYDIKTTEGTITVYEPQPQSFSNNRLSAIAAISFTQNGQDPVFGAVWLDALLTTDRDTRMVAMQELQVQSMKFPGDTDQVHLQQVKTVLERELPNQELNITMDELLSTLATNNAGGTSDAGLDNAPPQVIFQQQNSLLVQIDGQPEIQDDATLGMPRVQNTPFVILQTKSNQPYYLFFGGRWFTTSLLTGQWTYVSNPPSAIQRAGQQIQGDSQDPPLSLDSLPQIVVSTVPAELIQSVGKPNFAAINGTSLLYMTNTKDNIFMDITSQQYYVLLAGRWYRAPNLAGPWNFVDPAQLPADFANIPEGNDKDAVLASVAGTPAAREAVLDAQVPQTAKVDRQSASTSVTYDGSPQFEAVTGTGLEYAANTASTVLRDNRVYYVVDNGVWFTGPGPDGPWAVATTRPPDVDRIPPSAPVYNVRYVYIYDVRPDVVYMGYTPGYTGCYVMGPTVVYGTGFHYRPWYRHYYYARPLTWGFGMRYNPWSGWCLGIGMNFGMVHFGIGFGFGGGGWWGPPVYRPPFAYPYRHVYGPRPVSRPRTGPVRVRSQHNFYANRTNNIYNNRPNVVTRDRVMTRPGGNNVGNRPGTRPGNPGQPSTRPGNPGIRPGDRGPVTQPGNPSTRPGDRGPATQPGNPSTRPGGTRPSGPSTLPAGGNNRLPPNARNLPTMADQQGNVYQRNSAGGWQQRQGNQTTPANNNTRQQMEQQYQQRQRGTQSSRNFQQAVPRPQSAPSRPSAPSRSNAPARSAPRGRS